MFSPNITLSEIDPVTPPVHRQTAYRRFDAGRPLPYTEWLSSHSLTLPIGSNLPDEVALGSVVRLASFRPKWCQVVFHEGVAWRSARGGGALSLNWGSCTGRQPLPRYGPGA